MPAGLTAQVPSEATQHTILDAAKSFDWNKVFELLGSYPSAISCQPCGRWNVLHQEAFEPNPEAFCRLLEMRADAAARTRDGKSVVELVGLNDPSRVEDKDEVLRLFYQLYCHSSSGVEGQEIQRKIVEDVKDGMVVSCGSAMDKPN